MRRWMMVGAALMAGGCALAETSYLKPVSNDVAVVKPLITVGDAVNGYRMVGIPDGLGAFAGAAGEFTLLMNHELHANQGVKRWHGGIGAFVSRWQFKVEGKGDNATIKAVAGRDAFQHVYDLENGKYVKVPEGAFARFCSANLADKEQGFDRPIFMTGEEVDEDNNLDKQHGGQSVAVVGDSAYTLPRIGRYSKENQVPLAGTGELTVVMGLEDGPTTPDSQLYVYVGRKVKGSADPLERNGLTNGELYVMTVGSLRNELDLVKKGGTERFALKKVNWDQNGKELEAEADKAGALGFIRIEDGAQDPGRPSHFYFVTTGSGFVTEEGEKVNERGRVYRLEFDDLRNPQKGGRLVTVLNGSEGVISPDNVDMDAKGRLMICEDPTTRLTDRDSSVWMLDTRKAGAKPVRVLEMNQAAAGRNDGLGRWETSGVLDASDVIGEGWWIITVQAHYAHPDPELVEGGQLIAFRLKP